MTVSPRRLVGSSKLEFSVVAAVIALIAFAILNRLLDVQELGEKTAVEMTVSNIRSGLRIEMADRIMTGREGSIRELAGSNPVRWLDKQPDGYLGEFAAAPKVFQPGTWYFDTGKRNLRYWPNLERYLECSGCEAINKEAILGWRIVPAGSSAGGRSDAVKVVPVAEYRWF